MIQSMTAFATSHKQTDAGHIYWEIRSVNHKYLDVSFRLPEMFRPMEPEFRTVLKHTVHRGKIECSLRFQDTSSNNQAMLINMGMVNALLDAGKRIADTFQIANDMKVSDLLNWPNVFSVNPLDIDTLGSAVIESFAEAVSRIRMQRETEGSALQGFILSRLESLQHEVNRAKNGTVDLYVATKEKLLNRLKTLQMEISESGVEQEIALLLTRLDVDEEIDRLAMHIKDVHRSFSNGGVVGRKLDFLMQELQREANTLASKSDSMELTQVAVEMKVLIEQMREQIQNIE